MDPLTKRKFLHQASTQNSIQVVWSHPENFDKKSLTYELQYGVGVKVNKIEQFKKIYSGRAHKCIITDLMPKTSYRFRVVPILTETDSTKRGEWSDPISVSTKDSQTFDATSFGNCA